MHAVQLACGISGFLACFSIVLLEHYDCKNRSMSSIRMLMACFTFLLGWCVLSIPSEELKCHVIGMALLTGLHVSMFINKMYNVLVFKKQVIK